MTTVPMLPLALSTEPIDIGLIAAAVLLLVFAARTFLSGKGQAQMGMGFMLVAAVVWTFAIGRQVADFSAADGFRIAFGVVLLIPAFRVLFGSKSGATTAVVSLILSSVIAGPVITKAFPDREMKVRKQLEATASDLDAERELFDTLISLKAKQREVVEGFGISSTDELRGNAEAFTEAKRFSELDAKVRASQARIAELELNIVSLESSLASLQDDSLADSAKQRIDETLREIDAAAERRDGKSALDAYADDARALEVFEDQFAEKAGEGTTAEESSDS